MTTTATLVPPYTNLDDDVSHNFLEEGLGKFAKIRVRKHVHRFGDRNVEEICRTDVSPCVGITL